MNCAYGLLIIGSCCVQQVAWAYLRPELRHFQVFEQIPNLIPACNHSIYCKGPLLEAVMAFKLYKDSKTFVDKPLRFPSQKVLDNFNRHFVGLQVTRIALQKFVNDNFDAKGTELKSCKLDDWIEKPLALMSITDNTMREWAIKLHNIWKALCREVDIKVRKASSPVVIFHLLLVFLNEDQYSLIYLPNQFVLPGGRFLEYYYWDAYFILKGLLASGLFKTSRGMIENFVHLVNKYGFVPNGGRIYYLERSQPPVLIAMVYEYYEKTHDIEFLMQNLNMLEKELAFWDDNRRVRVRIDTKEYELYQYRVNNNAPRPESFREDIQLVKRLASDEDKKRIWQNIASAAESGWDFSSRWMADSHNLSSIETTDIIPVDLNAFICYNFNLLSYLFDEIGNSTKAEHYRTRFGRFRVSFQKAFYVQDGWFDYNQKKRKHNINFYPSMAVPLFTRCYDGLNHAQVEKIFQKMDEMGAFKFAGGVPTSLIMNTNQQWDYPNGWSPLNLMIIQGLRQSDSLRMQEKAFLLAQKWILSNYRVFQKTGIMWEKYSVFGSIVEPGRGGEYSVQAGFGWSNAVILDLLTTYADRLNFSLLEEAFNCTSKGLIVCDKNSAANLALIPILILFLGSFLYWD